MNAGIEGWHYYEFPTSTDVNIAFTTSTPDINPVRFNTFNNHSPLGIYTFARDPIDDNWTNNLPPDYYYNIEARRISSASSVITSPVQTPGGPETHTVSGTVRVANISDPASASAGTLGGPLNPFYLDIYDETTSTLLTTVESFDEIKADRAGDVNFSFEYPIDHTTVLSLKAVPHLSANGRNVYGDPVGNAPTPTITSSPTRNVTLTYDGRVLPVTLKQFTAVENANKNILLKWTTTEELNVKQIVVERSVDGKTFQAITSVAPKGNNSNVENNYTYVDNSVPAVSKIYYRLLIVDIDGSTKQSDVVSVFSKGTTENSIVVYPNIIAEKTRNVSVKINGGATDVSNISLRVYDISGKLVLQQNERYTAGSNITLNIQSLAKGMYVVLVANQDGSLIGKAERLVVQ